MKHVYEQNVSLTARDGVALMADVWRPLEGKAPTLLIRTPYDRRMSQHYGSFDEYWKSQDWSGPEHMSAVTVPVLSIGGWYDLKINGTVEGFIGVRTQGGSDDARDKSRLIIGPWDHRSFTGRFRDRYFGIRAETDISTEHIAFFDEHLRGKSPVEPAPRVRIFVMGIDQWRNESDWPLSDTTYTNYYLDSAGSAATRHGDGSLQVAAPATDSLDQFTYDPRDPVPTAGGALLPDEPGLIGPVDQSEVDGRADVLCYATPILEAPLEVTGHVELSVFVSSTALDTDITAKLVDVFPDGRAINLCDGMLRLRYREDLSNPALLTPDEVYEVTVKLGVTSNVFLPGHRLRLDVSSSNFPRFDRNTNTGGFISGEAIDEAVEATNRVHHGPAYPSRLTLPIIER
jgi:putative CocE/NonD family hydrolase